MKYVAAGIIYIALCGTMAFLSLQTALNTEDEQDVTNQNTGNARLETTGEFHPPSGESMP